MFLTKNTIDCFSFQKNFIKNVSSPFFVEAAILKPIQPETERGRATTKNKLYRSEANLTIAKFMATALAVK
jgi:hypothetical protein